MTRSVMTAGRTTSNLSRCGMKQSSVVDVPGAAYPSPSGRAGDGHRDQEEQ